jgi:hypothetical protein
LLSAAALEVTEVDDDSPVINRWGEVQLSKSETPGIERCTCTGANRCSLGWRKKDVVRSGCVALPSPARRRRTTNEAAAGAAPPPTRTRTNATNRAYTATQTTTGGGGGGAEQSQVVGAATPASKHKSSQHQRRCKASLLPCARWCDVGMYPQSPPRPFGRSVNFTVIKSVCCASLVRHPSSHASSPCSAWARPKNPSRGRQGPGCFNPNHHLVLLCEDDDAKGSRLQELGLHRTTRTRWSLAAGATVTRAAALQSSSSYPPPPHSFPSNKIAYNRT